MSEAGETLIGLQVFCLGILNGRDVGVDEGRDNFKALTKCSVRVWTGFIWIR
jgi:hypothetical protein